MVDTNDLLWCTNEYGDEVLQNSMDEAIEDALDRQEPNEWSCPETLHVYAWKRKELKPGSAYLDIVQLESMVENLDEEHGDPDGGGSDVLDSEAVQEAWREFVKVFVKHYHVWACEPYLDGDRPINKLEWIKKHRPDWIVSVALKQVFPEKLPWNWKEEIQ